MSASLAHDKHAEYNKPKFFLLSVIALATAGMAFGIRGDIVFDRTKIKLAGAKGQIKSAN